MAELKICSLRSSSKGNATIIYDEEAAILVDCGISGKVLFEAMEEAGFRAEELCAVVITHEHTDHTKGVGVVARKLGVPVFATYGTWSAMKKTVGEIPSEQRRVFDANIPFEVGGIRVSAFEIPHDGAEPVGYIFQKGDCKVAVATDIGVMTEEILERLKGSRRVLLESNYDLFMLEAGTYPYELKCRIKGEKGHLSNEDAALTARDLAESGACEIILGHISPENNYPDLAYETTRLCLLGHGFDLEKDVRLLVARKDGIVGKRE